MNTHDNNLMCSDIDMSCSLRQTKYNDNLLYYVGVGMGGVTPPPPHANVEGKWKSENAWMSSEALHIPYVV